MVPPPARRFDASALRAMMSVGLVAVLLAAGWWWAGRSREITTATRPATAATPSGFGSPSLAAAPPAVVGVHAGETPGAGASSAATGLAPGAGQTAAEVVVDVRGPVGRPGVHRLPAGARVLDAVTAAGGLRRGHGFGGINLARPLIDGEQIVVGRGRARLSAASAVPQAASVPQGGGGADPAAASGGTGSAGVIVDLNTATAAELEQLDGVGPVLAGRIVAHRQTGAFTQVEDLLDVDGIGDATLERLRASVRVG